MYHEGHKEFEEMADLPARLRDFEEVLDQEPCTQMHLVNGHEISGCQILSNSRRMCPACRLRLRFFHCIYNADAYKLDVDKKG